MEQTRRAMSRKRILVVEDDPGIQELLVFNLERAGYQVIASDSAEHAFDELDGPLPNLLIIDWMLPGASGIELARRLRRDELTAGLPLIMLTARSEEADKLRSFDVGIDDYLTKPFSPRELLARVKALLRRSGDDPKNSSLSAGHLTVDTASHRVTMRGQPVHIGPTEYRLLEFFIKNPERAYSRSQLLDQVWGRGVYLHERTVDVHILRLRKLLKSHKLEFLIETVRGLGYRFSLASTLTNTHAEPQGEPD